MYNQIEEDDAKVVNDASKLIADGNFGYAKELLLDVASRCPDNYEYEFVENTSIYIKFWDLEEFKLYVEEHEKRNEIANIYWIGSAYPRACYYLGYIYVNMGKVEDSLFWLNKSLMLEPNNAKIHNELSIVYNLMKNNEMALKCMETACKLSSIHSHDHAVALRGIGALYINMGRVIEAKDMIEKSLGIEPDNQSAKKMFLMIQNRLYFSNNKDKKRWWEIF